MWVYVTTDIFINRPKADVAAYVMDTKNTPSWIDGVNAVEWITEQPLQVGSKISFIPRYLGKTFEATYEVVRLRADKELVLRTGKGPFPRETTILWETTSNGGTKMTVKSRGEPTDLFKLFTPYITNSLRRSSKKYLVQLKLQLENSLAQKTAA